MDDCDRAADYQAAEVDSALKQLARWSASWVTKLKLELAEHGQQPALLAFLQANGDACATVGVAVFSEVFDA